MPKLDDKIENNNQSMIEDEDINFVLPDGYDGIECLREYIKNKEDESKAIVSLSNQLLSQKLKYQKTKKTLKKHEFYALEAKDNVKAQYWHQKLDEIDIKIKDCEEKIFDYTFKIDAINKQIYKYKYQLAIYYEKEIYNTLSKYPSHNSCYQVTLKDFDKKFSDFKDNDESNALIMTQPIHSGSAPVSKKKVNLDQIKTLTGYFLNLEIDIDSLLKIKSIPKTPLKKMSSSNYKQGELPNDTLYEHKTISIICLVIECLMQIKCKDEDYNEIMEHANNRISKFFKLSHYEYTGNNKYIRETLLDDCILNDFIFKIDHRKSLVEYVYNQKDENKIYDYINECIILYNNLIYDNRLKNTKAILRSQDAKKEYFNFTKKISLESKLTFNEFKNTIDKLQELNYKTT